MNYSFTYPNVLVILISAGLMAVIVFVLAGLKLSSQGNLRRGPMRFASIYALIISGLCIAATTGILDNRESMPPRPMILFVVVAVFIIFLSTQKVEGRLAFLRELPIHWLLFIQSFRILVEVALLGLGRENVVPYQLTWEGRNFDVVIGVLAIIVGYFAYSKTKGWKSIALIFNFLGLASLINIVSIALMSVPTPFRVYDINLLPLYFPGMLIPAFLAPFAAYFHILSLKQLNADSGNK